MDTHLNNFQFEVETSTEMQGRLMDILQAQGQKIVDLSSDMDAQSIGVDFLIDSKAAEFKYDTRINQTGNLALEIVSNLERGKAGWFLTSQAELLYYTDAANGMCYCIDLAKLRDASGRHNAPTYPMAKARTEGKYSSLCWLFKLTDAKQAGCVIDEIQL